MHWDRVPKTVFNATENPKAKRGEPPLPFIDRGPVGVRERLAFFRNIATSIECQGFSAVRKESLDLLVNEAKGVIVKNRFPGPNALEWGQYGIKHGKYETFVSSCENDVTINLRRAIGPIVSNGFNGPNGKGTPASYETVHWERYKTKGQIVYVQNDGHKRFPETKCDTDAFLRWMIKRCGGAMNEAIDKTGIEEYLLVEIYGCVAKGFYRDLMDGRA